MPHERPPYERGKVDKAALDRIMSPETQREKDQWERILTNVRRTPWWRQLFGLPPRKLVLPEPIGPEPMSPEHVGDDGFFAASPDEIDDETLENGPYRFEVVSWKQMDPVKLGALGAILGVGTEDELTDQMTNDLRGGASNETGLFQVPDTLRDALATVDEPGDPAARWLETDELRIDEWTLDDARDLIQQVGGLARRATAERKHVYVWWSL